MMHEGVRGSILILSLGIGPDRSGMHFADSGYGSIAQIAQRGHTSRVAVGGRRGAKSGQSFACGPQRRPKIQDGDTAPHSAPPTLHEALLSPFLRVMYAKRSDVCVIVGRANKLVNSVKSTSAQSVCVLLASIAHLLHDAQVHTPPIDAHSPPPKQCI